MSLRINIAKKWFNPFLLFSYKSPKTNLKDRNITSGDSKEPQLTHLLEKYQKLEFKDDGYRVHIKPSGFRLETQHQENGLVSFFTISTHTDLGFNSPHKKDTYVLHNANWIVDAGLLLHWSVNYLNAAIDYLKYSNVEKIDA